MSAPLLPYPLLEWPTENVPYLKTSQEMQLPWLCPRRTQNTPGGENDRPLLKAMEDHVSADAPGRLPLQSQPILLWGRQVSLIHRAC
jgi:hypothetical protein